MREKNVIPGHTSEHLWRASRFCLDDFQTVIRPAAVCAVGCVEQRLADKAFSIEGLSFQGSRVQGFRVQKIMLQRFMAQGIRECSGLHGAASGRRSVEDPGMKRTRI